MKKVVTQNNETTQTNTDNIRPGYSFYSKVLEKPFDSVEELQAAEQVYYDKLKAKEDKAAQKKADALKVEDAFKDLNKARRVYRETVSQLTTEYSEALKELKSAYELGKADMQKSLAAAEDNYTEALKEFTNKYPEGFHLTLKDGDFETTLSKQNKEVGSLADLEFISDFLKGLLG